MPSRDVSLFDVENIGDDMPRVADMTLGPVSPADVHEFGLRYHYTHSGGNAAFRWGLWHGVVLLGVVAYNIPTRNACASVFGVEHVEKVWHMGRLVLADEVPTNAESRLIAGSLREIHKRYPHVWAVLTFAAADVGHIGYVYQATNAIYTGLGGHSTYYVDEKGTRRPTYDGWFVSPESARARGWDVVEGQRKHRYLYVLGTAKQRKQRLALCRLPSLPYPKGDEQPQTSDEPAERADLGGLVSLFGDADLGDVLVG